MMVSIFTLLFAGGIKAQERRLPSLEGFYDGIHHWNLEHKTRQYKRYGKEQVYEIAANLMAYQNADGGWPKNIDWLAVLNPDSVYNSLKESYKRSTLDNRNTFPQIEYLADAYCLYQDMIYRDAALKGLLFLLNTQKTNGGWRGWDVDAITFNDDVTTGALELFRNIVQGDKSFIWLDAHTRKRIEQAFDKGVKLVLACQILQNGVRSGWAQQYDNETLVPVGARTFELPGITANETSEILLFLMGIEHPSQQVAEAVHCGMKWLDKAQLKGIKLLRRPLPEDKIILLSGKHSNPRLHSISGFL
jgi:PelA/Pel-15E family pectate lyase